MEPRDWILGLIKENLLVFLLLIVAGGLFFFGTVEFLTQKDKDESVVFEESEATESPKLLVDIEGAVTKPGLYKLPSDSRIQDVLIACGGFSGEADRDFIEKNINLASKVTDGMKIYIPRVGESLSSGVNTAISPGSSLVGVNSAGQAELEALPGIGPVTAGKIIAGRPYSSIDDLVAKKAVSQSVFEKIKDQISPN
ncbi:MAG: ComEA family DNA-binding protein [Candidatus Levybacteria bacterium]|nr:ComEA family DNA-binding protein [Candidatus Levybacteria bacterium]